MLRQPSVKLFINEVVVTPVVVVEGVRGGDQETYPGPGTTFSNCSVQGRGETAVKARRALGGGAEVARMTHCVYFRENPGVKVNDIIYWPSRDRTLKVLGTARDEGGHGAGFGVDCEETS